MLQSLGNHDFDYGPDVLLNYVKQLDYPILSGNILPNGHQLGNHVKPYTVITLGGRKIGICSATTTNTIAGSSPEPVSFEQPINGITRCASELEAQGVKIIILLSHLGYEGSIHRQS